MLLSRDLISKIEHDIKKARSSNKRHQSMRIACSNKLQNISLDEFDSTKLTKAKLARITNLMRAGKVSSYRNSHQPRDCQNYLRFHTNAVETQLTYKSHLLSSRTAEYITEILGDISLCSMGPATVRSITFSCLKVEIWVVDDESILDYLSERRSTFNESIQHIGHHEQ
jgi:RecG-like helicase